MTKPTISSQLKSKGRSAEKGKRAWSSSVKRRTLNFSKKVIPGKFGNLPFSSTKKFSSSVKRGSELKSTSFLKSSNHHPNILNSQNKSRKRTENKCSVKPFSLLPNENLEKIETIPISPKQSAKKIETTFYMPSSLNVNKENYSIADSESLLNPISISGSRISSVPGGSTPSITPYKLMRLESNTKQRFAVDKKEINVLESKIKELEEQIEETKLKKSLVLTEVEKRVDLVDMKGMDDAPLPKEPKNIVNTFDNILKSIDIGIDPSNMSESIYTKQSKRKRKEWSKRTSRQVSPRR